MSPRPPIDHIRRPQILEAAAAVIIERGLAATRIADVAERAGTSPAAVLYWFSTREELLLAALVADEERFAHDLGRTLAGVEGSPARLCRLIEETVAESDLSLWVELWALSLHDERAAAERDRLDRTWRELIASLITAGVADGSFRPVLDPAEAAVAVASMLDGLSLQVTLRDRATPPERMREMALAQASAIVGARLSVGEGRDELEGAVAL